MKNIVRIAGMLLILLVAGQSLEAQRGMRGFRNDTVFMKQRRDSIRMHMRERRMAMNSDSLDRGMRHFYGMPGQGRGNGAWMAPGMGRQGMRNNDFGYGRWMNPGMRQWAMRHQGFQNRGQGMMAYGRGMGPMMQNAPGRRIMESMPGVTSRQKEELKKLNEKQMDEFKKLREKHQEAIKALREDHQKKVMNLLTDEQKKWLEENAPEGRGR